METVLAILAHHDDEFFVGARLAWERSRGRRVAVVYTTYGSLYGAPAPDRIAESLAALESLGVDPRDVFQAGLETETFDSSLVDRLPECYARSLETARALRPARVLVMAWEGGHPDHDASHLLGVRLARALGAREVLAFSAYRSARGGRGIRLDRCLSPLPGPVPPAVRRVSLREGASALALFRFYRSQRASLLGVLPEAFWQLVVRRRERLIPVGAPDYRLPPHPGRLFYERRYGLPFARFRDRSEPFLRDWDAERAGGAP